MTKGAVYLVVGALAVGVASGMGGQTTDLAGALQTISTQPFGRVMLGFVALGLAAYALWRLVQAVADPEGEGRDAKGIASRLGWRAGQLTAVRVFQVVVDEVLPGTGDRLY